MINISNIIMYLRYYKKVTYLELLNLCKGLDYTGRIESQDSSFRGYEGCYPIRSLLSKMNISDKDSILDIGCGKGLALYYASIFGFGRIDGIEYSEKLTLIAKYNARKLNDSRIHIYNCDARNFTNYEKYNYFFINNPFSAEIMEQIVLAIIQSYRVNRRRIVVLYQFPFSIEVFKKNGFKMLCKEFPNSILTFG